VQFGVHRRSTSEHPPQLTTTVREGRTRTSVQLTSRVGAGWRRLPPMGPDQTSDLGVRGVVPFGRRPHPPTTPRSESLPARQSKALHAIQLSSNRLDLPVTYGKLGADFHNVEV